MPLTPLERFVARVAPELHSGVCETDAHWQPFYLLERKALPAGVEPPFSGIAGRTSPALDLHLQTVFPQWFGRGPAIWIDNAACAKEAVSYGISPEQFERLTLLRQLAIILERTAPGYFSDDAADAAPSPTRLRSVFMLAERYAALPDGEKFDADVLLGDFRIGAPRDIGKMLAEQVALFHRAPLWTTNRRCAVPDGVIASWVDYNGDDFPSLTLPTSTSTKPPLRTLPKLEPKQELGGLPMLPAAATIGAQVYVSGSDSAKSVKVDPARARQRRRRPPTGMFSADGTPEETEQP